MTHPAHGRPVVAGVDGSEDSLRAAHVAAQEALRRDAPLHLLTALAWPELGLTTPAPPDSDLPQKILTSSEDMLRGLAADMEPTLGAGRVSWELVQDRAVGALRAASQAAQLLVLGSRGVGGVLGLLVGSTATAVVAAAACPVLVLPDGTSVTVSRPRSVVVGVEGRTGDEDVLGAAFDEAAARRTDLIAVHAWQDARLDTTYQSISPLLDWSRVRADEERVLAEALAGWGDKQPDVVVREVVVRNRPAHALIAAALTAELLVIGHRRRNRLAALGSTTHGVLHRTPCPLMIVPIGHERDQ